MKFFTEYVPASEIWHNATNFIDKGVKEGLVRGYNVEVRKFDGTVGWACGSLIVLLRSIMDISTYQKIKVLTKGFI